MKSRKIRIIRHGIQLIEKLSPGFMGYCFLHAVLTAIHPFINLHLSALIINGFIEGHKADKLLLIVFLMIALNLICSGLAALFEKYVNLKQNILYNNYRWHLNKKLMDFSYEEAENYDTKLLREKINQMEQVNGMGIWNLVNAVKSGIQSVFTLAFALSAFGSILIQTKTLKSGNVFVDFLCTRWGSVLLVVLVICNVLVNLYAISRKTKEVFDGFEELVPINQVYSYYLDYYIDTYHSGKDIRLYKQKELIQNELEQLLQNGKVPMNKLKHIEFKYTSLSSFSSALFNIWIYLIIVFRAIEGIIPIGNIVLCVGAIEKFVTGFITLTNQAALLNANAEALELVLQYLDKESIMFHGNQQVDVQKKFEIKFENVSFTYPNTEEAVLKDISFSIGQGERVAIVGTNGSGKTTMIKLLCRLYDPNEGRILLNGIDIKEYDLEEYQKILGTVFQDFQLFSFKLGENVASDKEYDDSKVRISLEKAGIGKRLNELDFESYLYKDFNESGVEISGGEAQKIAIARALYKDTPILILDEPTAALDPQAEYEIYKNINAIAENKTVIFISHRMSSCKFANRILVFDKGQIVQEGSHETLLKKTQGRYRELWYAQEKHYQSKEER